MTTPRLTIGLPVYNGANYLAEAVTSILSQDFEDFELIISDNASDDDINIAYAIIRAAVRWNERRYLALAEPMVEDIGRLLLAKFGDRVLVRPAAFGFNPSQHRDGPVVNLSY